MKPKIYLVVRSSGQYEDYRTDTIAAYLDKKLAEQHVALATDALVPLRKRQEKWYEKMFGENSDPEVYTPFKGGTKFDPNAGEGFDTSYSVESLVISDRVKGA